MSGSATEQLVQLIQGLDPASLSQEARERAKLAMLDCLAALVAGTEDDSATIVRNHLLRLGGEPEALVIGATRRLPAEMAALANGTAAHALDFDDMCGPMLGHPSVPLVPVLLALADLQGATGQDLVTAYVVGFETEVRLGRVLNPTHYEHGWHATSTFGTLGAAAAAARLLRLDATQTANCLGIAASRSGGLRQNFGTMTKPLHPGDAAAGGLGAARLASAGFTAEQHILEAPQGFFAVFGQGTNNPVNFGLDAPLELERAGIALKLYPCCGCTHCGIDATVDLAQEHRFSAADVESVLVRTSTLVPRVLIHHDPRTPLEAKFSMEFCIAAALVDGNVTLDHFTPEQVASPEIRAMLSRVRLVADPSMEVIEGRLSADVTITLRDGREVSKRVDIHRGRPELPASPEQVAQKFRDCTDRFMEGDDREMVIRTMMDLERVDKLDSLLAALGRVTAPKA